MAEGHTTTLSQGSSGAPPKKLNAVPHEAQVVVTGARPGQTSGNRELFAEATTTVLVFENGAVIRLNAAVIPGQLLFLTHQEFKREVVAQVNHKRASRPSNCYVEVEFSEPFPGFWGVEFPKAPELSAVTAAQKEAAELVQSSPVTDDDPGELSFSPSMEEVVALKEEVEVLRQQLKLMQTQAPASLPATVVESPVPQPAALPKGEEKQSASLPLALPPVVAEPPALSVGVGPESKTVPRENSQGSFSEEDLLSKPALDFGSKSPTKKNDETPRSKAGATNGSGAARKSLLIAALLLVGIGAAYFEHWIPGMNIERANVSGSPRAVNPAPPVHPSPPGTQNGSPATSPAGGAPVAAQNQIAQTRSAATGLPETPTSGSAPHSTPAENGAAAESGATPTFASHKEIADSPAALTSVATRTVIRPSNEGSPDIAVVSGGGTGIVPPKLLKAVRPNPPAEALQGFVSGNVVLDALVDSSGHVKSMKILSGPEKLRKTAMEAMRQYKYEPATQNGKRVSAHVNETMQFWYEP